MGVLTIYMPVHHLHGWCLQRPEEDVGSSGTGAINGCELSWRCLELNLSPSEEQPVLLTILTRRHEDRARHGSSWCSTSIITGPRTHPGSASVTQGGW